MSATPFRSPGPKPAGPAVAGEAGRSPPLSRRWLYLATALALAWSATLLVMDVQTANPVVVSREQILESDFVVTGRPLAGDNQRVRVERVLHGHVDVGKEFKVLNLEGLPLCEEQYIFPLTHFRGDYVVTTLSGQRTAPLVYRVSPDTIESVKTILRDRL